MRPFAARPTAPVQDYLPFFFFPLPLLLTAPGRKLGPRNRRNKEPCRTLLFFSLFFPPPFSLLSGPSATIRPENGTGLAVSLKEAIRETTRLNPSFFFPPFPFLPGQRILDGRPPCRVIRSHQQKGRRLRLEGSSFFFFFPPPPLSFPFPPSFIVAQGKERGELLPRTMEVAA